MITQSDVDTAITNIKNKSPHYSKFLDTFKFTIDTEDDITCIATGVKFVNTRCISDDYKYMMERVIYIMCAELQDLMWAQVYPLLVDTDKYLVNCEGNTTQIKIVPFDTDDNAIYVPKKVYHKLMADMVEHNENRILPKWICEMHGYKLG